MHLYTRIVDLVSGRDSDSERSHPGSRRRAPPAGHHACLHLSRLHRLNVWHFPSRARRRCYQYVSVVVRISCAPNHAISCGFHSCSCLGICTVNRETETVLCPMSAGSDVVRDLCQPSPPKHMRCFATAMHASLCHTARGTFDGPTYRTLAVEMIASSGHARFKR